MYIKKRKKPLYGSQYYIMSQLFLYKNTHNLYTIGIKKNHPLTIDRLSRHETFAYYVI